MPQSKAEALAADKRVREAIHSGWIEDRKLTDYVRSHIEHASHHRMTGDEAVKYSIDRMKREGLIREHPNSPPVPTVEPDK